MRSSVCVVELNQEQQRSPPAAQGQAEREDTCFKDVSQCVMKARHNEAERPCSYLQSIKAEREKRGREMAGASGAEDDAALRSSAEMGSDGRLLKWKLNAWFNDIFSH